MLDDLRTSHAIYSPLFQRREQRTWAAHSLQGLLLEIPRTSIEPMILSLEGADAKAVRARQQCISDGRWDDAPSLQRHWQEVDTTLGEEDGVLTVDGSDFLKQGQESVGVKRQDCGAVGTRANGQAGVFLGSASRHGSTLRDRRRSLPRAWVEDEAYAARRRKCGVPADVPLQTTLALARDMSNAVCQAKTLRCRWVACDEAFGRDTVFLDQVASSGLGDFAEVPHETHVWRQCPKTVRPVWSGRGRTPSRRRLGPGQAVADTVSALAQPLPVAHWACHLIKEGRKGPMVADCVAVRVVAVREGLPGPEGWVVLRRSVTSGALNTSLCNAPADTPLGTLVRLSGMRWPIETCVEEGKQHLGRGDDAVRRWRGWHHHMTRCLVAHFFLVWLRRR